MEICNRHGDLINFVIALHEYNSAELFADTLKPQRERSFVRSDIEIFPYSLILFCPGRVVGNILFIDPSKGVLPSFASRYLLAVGNSTFAIIYTFVRSGTIATIICL